MNLLCTDWTSDPKAGNFVVTIVFVLAAELLHCNVVE